MSTVDTMTEDEIRNTAEFAEWIAQYNKLNHADLTTKTAPYYLFIDYLSTFITDDEIDKVDELTAENAKLREQLAILIEGGEAADELIMMLKGIVEHTASSNKVTPPGQDAARQILAKINAYHEKYT